MKERGEFTYTRKEVRVKRRKKSVFRLGIEPDHQIFGLTLCRLNYPDPHLDHIIQPPFLFYCGQRRQGHLSGCSDTNSAWVAAPDSRETLFLPGGELSR